MNESLCFAKTNLFPEKGTRDFPVGQFSLILAPDLLGKPSALIGVQIGPVGNGVIKRLRGKTARLVTVFPHLGSRFIGKAVGVNRCPNRACW